MTYDYTAVQHALTMTIDALCLLPIVVMAVDFLVALDRDLRPMQAPLALATVGASEPGLGSLSELFTAAAAINTDYDQRFARTPNLGSMTRVALLELARERGIKIGSKASKATILTALQG